MPLDVSKLRERIHIADGAIATQLRARGFPPRELAEKACLDAPDLVARLARDYLEAGAHFLTTNTFSANRLMLDRRGAALDVAELNRAAARIAIEARDAVFAERCAGPGVVQTNAARSASARRAAGAGKRPAPGTPVAAGSPAGADPFDADTLPCDLFVVGSIGTSGRIVSVREAQPEELTAAFAQQAAALAEAGVDALLLETFSELEEILIALRAARGAANIPIIASMSFDSGPQRSQTMMGQEAATCARALDEAGADLIGCNCGAGIAEALPAVFAIRNATQRPIWVKPSVGLPELENGVPVYRVTPEEFVEPVPTLLDAGADIIGGCCGVGPEHIRKLANLVESRARHARRQ